MYAGEYLYTDIELGCVVRCQSLEKMLKEETNLQYVLNALSQLQTDIKHDGLGSSDKLILILMGAKFYT